MKDWLKKYGDGGDKSKDLNYRDDYSKSKSNMNMLELSQNTPAPKKAYKFDPKTLPHAPANMQEAQQMVDAKEKHKDKVTASEKLAYSRMTKAQKEKYNTAKAKEEYVNNPGFMDYASQIGYMPLLAMSNPFNMGEKLKELRAIKVNDNLSAWQKFDQMGNVSTEATGNALINALTEGLTEGLAPVVVNKLAKYGDDAVNLAKNKMQNAYKYNPWAFKADPKAYYRGVGKEGIEEALMQEYNAIDYRKNLLSDKEKEMYKWFDEQMRFDKLPQTTNKQSIEVLDNFKQRIRTPEGQKRLKELGITEEQLLQDLKIVEDPNTYGYYRGAKNTIAMNPNHPLPKKVVRHEIEHGVQNALRQSKINKAVDGTVDDKMKALEINTTEIDDILSGLTLRREGTPNKVWSKSNINEPVNINNYKSLVNNKQNATDYFLTGSEGAEKSAFLGEVQQYMMDIGKIPKDSYTKITPEMVKETMIDAMFDEAGGGKYLRLFNIIKADSKNYEMISKALNKMLSISPLIGAGAYMQNKEYKNGGAIGNNGMFDMNNPNIYKALVPAIAGSAAYGLQEKKNGGWLNNYK